MKKFYLKQGDEVIVYFDDYEVETKVKGFYCYGMWVEGLGVIPFHSYSFYGAGYNQTQRFIVVKNKKHYELASLMEHIRLTYTND